MPVAAFVDVEDGASVSLVQLARSVGFTITWVAPDDLPALLVIPPPRLILVRMGLPGPLTAYDVARRVRSWTRLDGSALGLHGTGHLRLVFPATHSPFDFVMPGTAEEVEAVLRAMRASGES